MNPFVSFQNDFPRSSSLCKCGQEQQQVDLANTAVICEWADKIFGSHFQTTDELAHHLASNKLVSSSVASLTVLSTGGKDASSVALGAVKLPSTPEERRKETNNQLQRTIQQRQLRNLKEQQSRQGSEQHNPLKSTDLVKADRQWEDRKTLSRSHSVPNEIQMNASSKYEESLLGGSRLTSRQGDQQRNPTQTSGLQTNNNSNNSNQSAAGSTTIALPTVKESPNNKRRFTPIQPKTPVRDSAVKIPVNNRQMVLVQPNGAILKGQKIQQLRAGVQFIHVAGLPNGAPQQMANSKSVTLGTAKPNCSLPGTSKGQNIVVLSPGQVLKGSPVAGSLLVVNQSPSAGLATTSLVSGSIPGSIASTGQRDLVKTSPSQSNNHNVMLQLQSDTGGASPQGAASTAHSGIIPLVTSLSPLRGDISYQSNKSSSCPSSSTVLPRSVSVEPQTITPNTSNLILAVNSQSSDFATVNLSLNQSTSVTFATQPMRKQTSESPFESSLAGHPQSNIVPSDGRFPSCTSSNDNKIPISMANSASALLAIFSNTANREQGLHVDENRAIKQSPRLISHIGGSTGALPAVNLPANGIATQLPVSAGNQQSLNSVVCVATEVSQASEDNQKRLCLAALPNTSPAVKCDELSVPKALQSLQYATPTSLTLPNKTQTYQQPVSSSYLMSMLKAPVLGTTQMSHQQTSGHGQIKDESQRKSTCNAFPVYSVPIHTCALPLVSQGTNGMPIAVDLGNKRLALAPGQFAILSQINELPSDSGEAVNANKGVKEEMEILGSRFHEIQASLAGSLGNGYGQCTPMAVTQQQASIDIQGRQSITPSFNPHSNTATPNPSGMDSVPQSPNDPNQVFFKFTPIQQSVELNGVSLTSPSPVKPMQKPKPTHPPTSQGNFATPSRKRRSSGTTRRPNSNSTITSLPPAVIRQITPTPSPSGSRCSTPLSPSLISTNSHADTASMPPPSPGMILYDSNQPTTNRGIVNCEPSTHTLSQVTWGSNILGGRKRNPSGPPSLMQPAKQLSLDAATFLPEELNDLNIQTYDSNFDLNRAQQHYQRSHSVPLPAYQPVVLSQDRFISNFPTSAEQRGITVNNRSFGAKRNLTQELQEIQVTDEDFNPEEHFLDEGNDTAFSDLLNADLQQPTEGQGPWAADSALNSIQPECSTDLNVDFPISSCSSEQVTESELGLTQSLADNSNSTTSTLNEEIAAMDDIGSNPVFRDFTLPSWQQIGSSSNLTTLECGM